MADPTVNSQITDAVTQVDLNVVGAAPAVAMAMVYQMGGQAVGLTMENATAIQNGMQQVGIALVSTAAAKILSLGPSGGGGSGGSSPK